MLTNRPKSGKTTLHRDGSVTLWDCLAGRWDRTYRPSDAVIATLGEYDRIRVVRHIERHADDTEGRWAL